MRISMFQAPLDQFILRGNNYATLLGVASLILLIFSLVLHPLNIEFMQVSLLTLGVGGIFITFLIWFLTAIGAIMYSVKYDSRLISHIIRLTVIILIALVRYFFK